MSALFVDYEAELLEVQVALRDLHSLRQECREFRNARLARRLAAAGISGESPDVESLAEWRSLSAVERFQAFEAAELPERWSGGAILSFIDPKEQS